MMPVSSLKPGQKARVERIDGDSLLQQRLAEFGLFEGEIVEFIGTAPLGDPLELRVGETRLSLRKQDAASVLVSDPLA